MLAASLAVGCGDRDQSSDSALADTLEGGLAADASELELDAADLRDAATSRDAASADAAPLDGSSSDASPPGPDGMDASHDATPAASDAAHDSAVSSFETGPGPAPDAGSSTLTGSVVGLDFKRLEVGVQSGTQTWTLTNSGSAASGALSLVNPDPSVVSVTNGCTAALAAGASCNVSIALKLSQGGVYTGWLRMQSAQSGSLNLNLSANGAYRLTVATSGTGTVTSTSGGIACGATCTGLFDAGTTLTLQARTSNGSNHFFSGWGGAGCSGARRDCQLTIGASIVRLRSPPIAAALQRTMAIAMRRPARPVSTMPTATPT